MTITYQVKDSVYVNLTNRCPCACTFCLRNNADSVYGSPSLWLEREPTLDEVVASLDSCNWERFGECVFCGYGEPTERLDVLLAAAAHMKATHPNIRTRVNTNGLSDLIAGRTSTTVTRNRFSKFPCPVNTREASTLQTPSPSPHTSATGSFQKHDKEDEFAAPRLRDSA